MTFYSHFHETILCVVFFIDFQSTMEDGRDKGKREEDEEEEEERMRVMSRRREHIRRK